MSNPTARTGASSFHSPHLAAAIQKLEPTMASYKATIDSLCSDIVAVERYLQEKLIFVEVVMGTGIPADPMGEYDGIHFKLRWAEDKTGKFRLLCCKENEGDESILDARPLAESPVYLRVALAQQLPEFLEKVEEEVKKWQEAYAVTSDMGPKVVLFERPRALNKDI